MCSARDSAALPTLGFPIRESAGHWPFSASPRLIAAVHARLRLLVPRHPPCALNILTVISGEPHGSPGDTRVIGYCAVFKVREEAGRTVREPGTWSSEHPAVHRSLKAQQHASHLGMRSHAPVWPAKSGRRSSGRPLSRRAPRSSESSKRRRSRRRSVPFSQRAP